MEKIKDQKKVHIEIGKLIRKARESKKMSQQELAAHLGYTSPQFVSMFERGLSPIPLQTIGKISKILPIPEKKIIILLTTDYRQEILSHIHKK